MQRPHAPWHAAHRSPQPCGSPPAPRGARALPHLRSLAPPHHPHPRPPANPCPRAPAGANAAPVRIASLDDIPAAAAATVGDALNSAVAGAPLRLPSLPAAPLRVTTQRAPAAEQLQALPAAALADIQAALNNAATTVNAAVKRASLPRRLGEARMGPTGRFGGGSYGPAVAGWGPYVGGESAFGYLPTSVSGGGLYSPIAGEPRWMNPIWHMDGGKTETASNEAATGWPTR